MTIHAYKIGEDDGKVVFHRNFDGEHEDSENCWCRPEVIDSETLTTAEVVADRLETCDG